MSNDLVITGVPRSGTSYLCTILNEVNNFVVINEPNEVFQVLRNDSEIPLTRYYDVIREKIRNQQPIQNKIVDGKFIEDTNVLDVTEDYVPDVDRSDFVLGTKNTLIYMSSIERLRRQFSNETIVACVRNPVDTIASWSNVKFPHIKNVEMNFLAEYSDESGQKAISRVMSKSSLAQRYAMWWDYLAKRLLKISDDIMLIRYEDMVVDPEGTIDSICSAMSFDVEMKKDIEPSSPRSHRDQLSDDIIDAIRNYCKNSASKLGYKI